MSEPKPKLQIFIGGLLLAIGFGVFAVRFVHEGAYAAPQGGVLLGGLGSLGLGALLVWAPLPRLLGWLGVAVSPILLFLCLYSFMAELEEVISLYATDAAGQPVELRLWIVDREDGEWVGMPRQKAVEHSLNGARLEVLRGGETRCVVPVLHEDRDTVRAIHTLKVEKYAVARAAGAIGLYPQMAPDTTVALRLEGCDTE